MKAATIKENLAKLDQLLKYFEDNNEQFDLDQGLKNYEAAMKIVAGLKKELAGYELKVKEVQAKYDTDDNLSEKTNQPVEDSLL